MGQQEYDNFKRLIKEWLDSHPNEYADFVEEMNDKKVQRFLQGFQCSDKTCTEIQASCRQKNKR